MKDLWTYDQYWSILIRSYKLLNQYWSILVNIMPVLSLVKSALDQYWPVLHQWSVLNQYWSDMLFLLFFASSFGQYWFSTDKVFVNTDQYWLCIDFISVFHSYVFVGKTIYLSLKTFFIEHSLIVTKAHAVVTDSARPTDKIWWSVGFSC